MNYQHPNPFEFLFNELEEIKTILRDSHILVDEIIDRPELQRRLKISEPTAMRWGKMKKIPEIRIDGNIRYSWLAVVKSLEKLSK